jgi:hypothetical protein
MGVEREFQLVVELLLSALDQHTQVSGGSSPDRISTGSKA